MWEKPQTFTWWQGNCVTLYNNVFASELESWLNFCRGKKTFQKYSTWAKCYCNNCRDPFLLKSDDNLHIVIGKTRLNLNCVREPCFSWSVKKSSTITLCMLPLFWKYIIALTNNKWFYFNKLFSFLTVIPNKVAEIIHGRFNPISLIVAKNVIQLMRSRAWSQSDNISRHRRTLSWVVITQYL